MNTKTRLDDLVVFGGRPAFEEQLHVGRPNIGSRERLLERVNAMLDRRWLTNNGPYVQELEKSIADLIGVKHCLAICNGTIALELAIRANKLTGEVIVPSYTFVATAHALQWQGVTPVFCDIDADTHTLDPHCVEELITPRTTGILGVHLWGRPCDVAALSEVARRHDLKLLFDAAHAFGCSYRGQMIGNFGLAEIFSFHATKFFNTFEGGAVVTNSDEIAAKIRLLRNFGFAGHDNVVHIGTNGKMSEVSAAMGLTMLENLDELITTNYLNYQQYQRQLRAVPGVQLVLYDETERCNYQYIVLEVDEAIAAINAAQLVYILHAENILARRYFYPGCHGMEPYRTYYPHARERLPKTERMADRVLCLPTGTAIGAHEVSQICQVIHLVTSHCQEVRSRLLDEAPR